ncbi:unnamed protein product [Dovyalis caffra]|uniref:Uncharacterized protein n=1 Tax=Dovyalis caffra TaxID=77055 RepID=A0AAV1RBZ7_9ROSI|nr:unnamed protein product [Dovyalis caffra]
MEHIDYISKVKSLKRDGLFKGKRIRSMEMDSKERMILDEWTPEWDKKPGYGRGIYEEGWTPREKWRNSNMKKESLRRDGRILKDGWRNPNVREESPRRYGSFERDEGSQTWERNPRGGIDLQEREMEQTQT